MADKRSRLLRKAARKSEQAKKRKAKGWPQAARRSEREAYDLKREARNSCGRGRKAVYSRGKKVGCRTKRRR